MTPILFDTNIVLDLFLERQPFASVAKTIVSLHLEKRVPITITSLSTVNMHYIIRKNYGIIEANKSLDRVLSLFYIIDTTKVSVYKSYHSTFKDFEDGVQYFSGLESEIQILITRNKKDFVETKMKILTPSEDLKELNQGLPS